MRILTHGDEQIVGCSIALVPTSEGNSPKIVQDDRLSVLVLDRVHEFPGNRVKTVDSAVNRVV